MVVTAKGKNIDTSLFQNLFVQGEKFAEKIVFRIQRHYRDSDLKSCIFIIKGTNCNNETAEQILSLVKSEEDYLELEWNVSSLFTSVSGKLNLEIQALTMIDSEISYLLKFILPSVSVKASPTGENLPVPDIQEQVIDEINSVVAEGIQKINNTIETFDISKVEKRIDSLEDTIESLSSGLIVKAMTLEEYNSVVHSQNILYVII